MLRAGARFRQTAEKDPPAEDGGAACTVVPAGSSAAAGLRRSCISFLLHDVSESEEVDDGAGLSLPDHVMARPLSKTQQRRVRKQRSRAIGHRQGTSEFEAMPPSMQATSKHVSVHRPPQSFDKHVSPWLQVSHRFRRGRRRTNREP